MGCLNGKGLGGFSSGIAEQSGFYSPKTQFHGERNPVICTGVFFKDTIEF